MAKISKESFEEWLENPVTEAFQVAMAKYAETLEKRLYEEAWSALYLTPERQVALGIVRGRLRMAVDLSELSFEDYEEFLDDGATGEAR